jgi:hypothetical protein
MVRYMLWPYPSAQLGDALDAAVKTKSPCLCQESGGGPPDMGIQCNDITKLLQWDSFLIEVEVYGYGSILLRF